MLTFILKWLGGGVLNRVLGHLESKAKTETDRERIKSQVTIKEIEFELARRNAQKDVLLAETGHRWAWLPRFTFGISAAFYFVAIVVDSVFDLPGVVLAMPDNVWPIMIAIVSGLFLEDVVKRVRG
ncbi:MAG: hypothetical protein H0X01_00610 [Nitrospira sp.]|nr:hypothetical protein [Nitrospira sp.]